MAKTTPRKAKAKLSDFKPQRENINKGKPHALTALDQSIRRDGYSAPMVAAADGEIFAGSKRLERSADVFGLDIEPIIVESDGKRPIIHVRTDIPSAKDPRAKRLGYADNALAVMDWNPDGELLAQLAKEDEIVAALAKQENESLKALMESGNGSGDADAEPQIDKADELREKWGVKAGDLWQIGEHRLICGDCTDAVAVARVMGGERAGACVTDSPYGINREGIENDDPEGLRALMDGCLAVMPIDNGVIINFQSPRLFPIWIDAVRQAGHELKRALWMYDENDQTKPWHYWLMCSQIAIISTIGNPEWLVTKGHHDTYVIGLSREFRAGGDGNEFAHASVKPVGVVQDILSHIGGVVYEPFTGSGTTLVACQNLGRVCRAIEISPAYCAVILQRMTDAFPHLDIHRA